MEQAGEESEEEEGEQVGEQNASDAEAGNAGESEGEEDLEGDEGRSKKDKDGASMHKSTSLPAMRNSSESAQDEEEVERHDYKAGAGARGARVRKESKLTHEDARPSRSKHASLTRDVTDKTLPRCQPKRRAMVKVIDECEYENEEGIDRHEKDDSERMRPPRLDRRTQSHSAERDAHRRGARCAHNSYTRRPQRTHSERRAQREYEVQVSLSDADDAMMYDSEMIETDRDSETSKVLEDSWPRDRDRDRDRDRSHLRNQRRERTVASDWRDAKKQTKSSRDCRKSNSQDWDWDWQHARKGHRRNFDHDQLESDTNSGHLHPPDRRRLQSKDKRRTPAPAPAIVVDDDSPGAHTSSASATPTHSDKQSVSVERCKDPDTRHKDCEERHGDKPTPKHAADAPADCKSSPSIEKDAAKGEHRNDRPASRAWMRYKQLYHTMRKQSGTDAPPQEDTKK